MLVCGHDDSTGRFGVCSHVRDGADHLERFTGRGADCDLICTACNGPGIEIDAVCRDCRDRARQASDNEGFIGEPAAVDEPSAVRFEHLPPRRVPISGFSDLRARVGSDRDRWIGLTLDRRLVELDLDRVDDHGFPELTVLAHLPTDLGVAGEAERDAADAVAATEPVELTLHLSRDGKLAAVAQEGHGLRALIIDLETGAQLMELVRDTYCCEHSTHSIAFVDHDGRTLVVHATQWNRLDVHDPRTGVCLTARDSPVYARGEPSPPHYLDYFHCGLFVSPDQRRIVDNGWVWQPDGVITTWRIDDWVTKNAWESEDGPSKKQLLWRGEWDEPMCWIDDTHVAIWGYGQDQRLVAAVRIFDADAGTQVRWFPGPRGELVFDRVLVSLDASGAAVWNVERGTRLCADTGVSPTRYHPSAKTLIRFDGHEIHRSRLLGLDASYCTGAIAELADRIAREHAYADDLPVLGDALEAAGCDDREMLAHCQQPGEHADRCWVLERLRPRT